MASSSISQPAGDLAWVIGWLAVLWLVLLLEVLSLNLFGIDLRNFGVRPHQPIGLVGIVLAPFLHANAAHLAANSVSLFIVGYANCKYSRSFTMIAATYATIIGGLSAWLFGSPLQCHIGASGVVFGLIGFLLLNAVVRHGCLPLLLGLFTLFLFGGSIEAGFLKDHEGNLRISREMHLGGFLGGLLASWQLRRVQA